MELMSKIHQLRLGYVYGNRYICMKSILILKSSLSSKISNLSTNIPSRSALTKNPWIKLKDPDGSGLIYYWNPLTNETTWLGSPKPQHWIEVVDKESALSYWWNVDTDETTLLDSAKPSPFPHLNMYAQLRAEEEQQYMMVGTMGAYFLIGISLSFGAVLVRQIFE